MEKKEIDSMQEGQQSMSSSSLSLVQHPVKKGNSLKWATAADVMPDDPKYQQNNLLNGNATNTPQIKNHTATLY
jgi:hypothetical protein